MGNERKELREEMKIIMANLDQRWLKAASLEVCERLTHHFQEVSSSTQHILLFQPLRHGFVDLTSFLARQVLQGRRLYIPCGGGEKPTFFEIQPEAVAGVDLTELRVMQCENMVNAPFTTSDAEHTAVIMPGLAFDGQGNRIGWGKLSYEQLMSRPGMGKAQKIGVCWSLQFLSDIPATNIDLLVDMVCHERAMFATGTDARRNTVAEEGLA